MSPNRLQRFPSRALDVEEADEVLAAPPDEAPAIEAQFEGYKVVELVKVALSPARLTPTREVAPQGVEAKA